MVLFLAFLKLLMTEMATVGKQYKRQHHCLMVHCRRTLRYSSRTYVKTRIRFWV